MSKTQKRTVKLPLPKRLKWTGDRVDSPVSDSQASVPGGMLYIRDESWVTDAESQKNPIVGFFCDEEGYEVIFYRGKSVPDAKAAGQRYVRDAIAKLLRNYCGVVVDWEPEADGSGGV